MTIKNGLLVENIQCFVALPKCDIHITFYEILLNEDSNITLLSIKFLRMKKLLFQRSPRKETWGGSDNRKFIFQKRVKKIHGGVMLLVKLKVQPNILLKVHSSMGILTFLPLPVFHTYIKSQLRISVKQPNQP